MNTFYEQFENEHIIKNLLNSNKISHAILLVGSELKCKLFAKFIAANIIGKNPLDFVKNEINHTNIIKLEGNLNSSITIDDVRWLKHENYKKAYGSYKKIYMIDNAQNLTLQAQNAFLKLLEEPEGDDLFILMAPNRNSFLNTILSRILTLNLKPVTQYECKVFLISNFNAEECEARYLSEIFDGSLEESIACIRDEDSKKLLDFAQHIFYNIFCFNVYNIMIYMCKLKNKEEFLKILKYLKYMLLYKVKSDFKLIKFVVNLIDIINETSIKLQQNCNLNITLNWFVSQLI